MNTFILINLIFRKKSEKRIMSNYVNMLKLLTLTSLQIPLVKPFYLSNPLRVLGASLKTAALNEQIMAFKSSESNIKHK